MKRNFTAKSLFLLMAIAVSAIFTQTQAQVEWGIIGGINSANMQGSAFKNIPDSSQPKFSGITRFRAGIFMDYPLNSYFSFNPEIAYSVKGSVQKMDSVNSVILTPPGWVDRHQTVSNIDLGYIEIPLMFRFSTQLGNPTAMYPHENSVKPFYLDFFAGPYFGYLLSAKNEYSITSTRSSSDTSAEYNFSVKMKGSETMKKVKKIDYGAAFGMGIKWRFNRKSYLYLEGRYTMSFGQLNGGYWNRTTAKEDDPTQSQTVVPKIKNAGTLTVSLGFITHFSKRRYFGLQIPDKNRP